MKVTNLAIALSVSVLAITGCSQQQSAKANKNAKGISPMLQASNAQKAYANRFGTLPSSSSNNVKARVNSPGSGAGSSGSSTFGAGSGTSGKGGRDTFMHDYTSPLTGTKGRGGRGSVTGGLSQDRRGGAAGGSNYSSLLNRTTSGAGGSGSYTRSDLKNPKTLLAKKVVYFEYDSSTIRSEDFDMLDAHADFLKDYTDITVRLEGHADERGSREYNVALSEQRAQAVLWYLKGKGVPDKQMETIAYGEEKPAVSGESERSWAKNRRVELNYYRY